MADGQLADVEREAAITATEDGAAEASNAWSYVVTAASACLHPVGLDAADIVLTSINSYHWELFNRPYHDNCVALIRDIFANPFQPLAFAPAWRTSTAVAIARQMYDCREFSAMPILADALQDAGCDDEAILNHCRGTGPHVRGCWVVDLLTGRK